MLLTLPSCCSFQVERHQRRADVKAPCHLACVVWSAYDAAEAVSRSPDDVDAVFAASNERACSPTGNRAATVPALPAATRTTERTTGSRRGAEPPRKSSRSRSDTLRTSGSLRRRSTPSRAARSTARRRHRRCRRRSPFRSPRWAHACSRRRRGSRRRECGAPRGSAAQRDPRRVTVTS